MHTFLIVMNFGNKTSELFEKQQIMLEEKLQIFD